MERKSPRFVCNKIKECCIYCLGGFNYDSVDRFFLVGKIILIVFFLFIILLGAQYTRRLRERIELASSATKLKQVLESLKARAGKTEFVSVPSGLLAQAAKIESATIAKERDDAVLKSAASRSTGYAIRFGADVPGQTTGLNTAERVELDDMVTQLSMRGELAAEGRAGDDRPEREAKGKRLIVEYQVDKSAQSILVTTIRPRDDGPGERRA